MKIFFSKAAIALNEWLSKSGLKGKSYLCCAIILLLLGILLSGLFLNKIYEVPVNYTEFQILHEGVMSDGELHLSITRDYDRNRASDDDILRSRRSSRKGGVFVEGFFFKKDSTLATHSTWFNDSPEKRKMIGEILDTAHFDYKNNTGETVYIMTKITTRQKFNLIHQDESYSWELFNRNFIDTTDYYHSGIYKTHEISNKYIRLNVWNIPVDTLFCYGRMRTNHASSCHELFYSASLKDEAIPVFSRVRGFSFEKPNPLTSAEDVSKSVEIVRFPVATARFVKSLTIDYRCPTEFGYLNPEPDERTISSIRYYDEDKIYKIAWDGLKFHAKFPDMENVQEIRLFALTTIVTLLITAFLTCLYRLFSDSIYNFYKKHTKLFWSLLIVVVVVVSIYANAFYNKTNADYKNNDFETFDNGHEWER